MTQHSQYMRQALALARKATGFTSPNPMVGAILVKNSRIIGRGWHRRAGMPHAEIEALNEAASAGQDPRGASLYVTLEPCSTTGRTPPCTETLIAAGVKKVFVGATDPNPRHAGRGFDLLRQAGIEVTTGVLAEECNQLNEAFNRWITSRMPFVTVKAAMTLDGKIATQDGQSKWITGTEARAYGMRLRQKADAIIVGINTVLLDDPAMTVRGVPVLRQPRRVILDAEARTPPSAQVVADDHASRTTVFVGRQAARQRVEALAKRVAIVRAPGTGSGLDLAWILHRLGEEQVTSVLVEGGGEVNASFLMSGLAQRVAFFYAPKVLGGKKSRRGVAGDGAGDLDSAARLGALQWRRLGSDLLLTALVDNPRDTAGRVAK